MASKNTTAGNRKVSEAAVERRLAKEVKATGGICWKLSAAWVAGTPDRLCLLPGGRVIFVEVKAPGKKPRKLQLLIHKKLRALGFRVEVIDTIEGVLTFIQTC